jgi:hypothetical protein
MTSIEYKLLEDSQIFEEVCEFLGTKSEYYGEKSAIFEDFSEIEVRVALEEVMAV